MTAQEFTRKYPVGTPVFYKPVLTVERFHPTQIESEPWAMGSGHLVVKVKGIPGGVSIDHIVTATDMGVG